MRVTPLFCDDDATCNECRASLGDEHAADCAFLRPGLQFGVSVAYDLKRFDFGELDSWLEALAGFDAQDAGAGFGERDLTFYFDTEDAARAFEKKVIVAMYRRGVEVSVYPDANYPEDDDDAEA
jgi:hypothetical protein